MRRGAGYLALTAGLVILFLAPLARFYVLPRVAKIPTDVSLRLVSEGGGTYLDATGGFRVVGPATLREVRVVRGDPNDGDARVAVWDQFDRVYDISTGHALANAIDRFTLDRSTGAGVDCCGQNEDRTGALALAMPIGTRRATYPFWDGTAKRAFPMEYRETVTLDGVTVFHFHQRVAPITIGSLTLPGSVVGDPSTGSVDLAWWYAAETDVWVEPVTGVIVQAGRRADQWLADDHGERRVTVATTALTSTPETVRAMVDRVRPLRAQMGWWGVWLPIGGPVAAAALIALGLLLLGGIARAGSEPNAGVEALPGPGPEAAPVRSPERTG